MRRAGKNGGIFIAILLWIFPPIVYHDDTVSRMAGEFGTGEPTP
jgi:hypothetical protein